MRRRVVSESGSRGPSASFRSAMRARASCSAAPSSPCPISPSTISPRIRSVLALRRPSADSARAVSSRESRTTTSCRPSSRCTSRNRVSTLSRRGGVVGGCGAVERQRLRLGLPGPQRHEPLDEEEPGPHRLGRRGSGREDLLVADRRQLLDGAFSCTGPHPDLDGRQAQRSLAGRVRGGGGSGQRCQAPKTRLRLGVPACARLGLGGALTGSESRPESDGGVLRHDDEARAGLGEGGGPEQGAPQPDPRRRAVVGVKSRIGVRPRDERARCFDGVPTASGFLQPAGPRSAQAEREDRVGAIVEVVGTVRRLQR